MELPLIIGHLLLLNVHDIVIISMDTEFRATRFSLSCLERLEGVRTCDFLAADAHFRHIDPDVEGALPSVVAAEIALSAFIWVVAVSAHAKRGFFGYMAKFLGRVPDYVLCKVFPRVLHFLSMTAELRLSQVSDLLLILCLLYPMLSLL